MEPLFFKAENRNGGHVPAFWYDGLQWSRFFSKRKIWCGAFCRKEKTMASMEPLFFKAENKRTVCLKNYDSEASMEPLFFKAENGGILPGRRPPMTASIEPLFFKAENLGRLWNTRALKGFNGAAFFQSGKY